MRLVLFDIDGTLMRAGGAGKVAFEYALRELFDAEVPRTGFSFAGMTDRAIARRCLSAQFGAGADLESKIDRLIVHYLARLPAVLAEMAAQVVEVPGTLSCLRRLQACSEEVALGIGTGNVRKGAELKLGAIGIAEVFSFGAYGCDAEDRGEVLRAGELRGRAAFPQAKGTVVVGDTVRDVAAAQKIGAPCIGIATGADTHEVLKQAGAFATFDDLSSDAFIDAVRFGP